jgi:hypothetical protein
MIQSSLEANSLTSPPLLSVIVVTPDNYGTVRQSIRHLNAQKERERIEVILVAPSRIAVEENDLTDFYRVRIIEVGHMLSTARARAAGVRAASAEIVAFVEDHAFPAPGWAGALIRAHEKNWAAVGPVMANANPRTLISWINLAIEYSYWLEPMAPAEAEHLPGHNCSYKRPALLGYGDQLEEMMDAESVLHWDLRAKGLRLAVEPGARTFHQNFSKLLPSIVLRFHGGRLFASSRARHWPIWRSILFTGASPLIPSIRLARIVRELRREGRPRHLLPKIIPGLLLLLAFDGIGEMVGYAFGAGASMEILSEMEFHRHRYLQKIDQLETAAATTG